MPNARRSMAAMAAALLATLLVLPPTPAAAGGSQPEAPSDLRSISALQRSLDAQNNVVTWTDSYVQWDLPTNRDHITCYYVRWRVAAKGNQPAGAWQPSEQGAIAPRYRDYHDIDGLTIGETYDFEVRSYSESQGAYSDWVTLNKTLAVASTDSSLQSLTLSTGTLAPAFDPQKWSAVTYTATVANSVTSVTFTPTASDEGSTITFKGAETASGAASPAISLAPGPNYFQIQVAAEYGAYWRTYNLNVIRALPAGRLAAPTGVTLTQGAADGKSRITLSWTPPAGATAAVLEYQQVRSAQSVPTWSSVGVIDLTTSGGKIFTRLSDNVDYAVRVAGKNSSGTGAWATTTFTAPSTPHWPLNIAAASGDASLAVSWDPPSSTGYPGATISGYNVRWRPLPDNPCCPWSDAVGSDVGDVGSYTITGLTNNQVYEVQVSARNALGSGLWSETVLATPAELVGSPPEQQQQQQQQQQPQPEQQQQQQQPQPEQQQQQQDQQAQPTEDATESDPPEKPGAVQDVQTTVDGSKVTVTWTAPQGGEPSTYVVRMKTAKKGKAKIKRVGADATSVTFGKVKAGTHTVYVRAKNDVGGGKWTKTTVTVP